MRRGRVAEAMVETYRDLCKRIKFVWSEDVHSLEHEALIRKIGDQPFDFTRLQWVPGAQTVLQKLQLEGHRLCFLSCYDTEVFPKKAEYLNLYGFFRKKDVLVIQTKKTAEDFVAVSGWKKEHDELNHQWYAVGNGESDIKPPLDISECWRGIYIPHQSTSQYFRGRKGEDYWSSISIDHPRVVTIRSMSELPSVI